MRVNSENVVKNHGDKTKAWLAEEIVRCLREVFDRMDKGDMTGIDEFRHVFCFGKSEEKKDEPV